MGLIKPERVKELETDMKANFQKGIESEKVDTSHLAFSMVVPSNSASNTYEWMGEMVDVTEWVGPRKLGNVQMIVYEVHNKSWENSIKVTEMDLMNNNLAGRYLNAQALGTRIKSHPAKLNYEVLANGHLNLCYDGQNFFDKEHPVYEKNDGTGKVNLVSNMDDSGEEGSLAWYLMDTTDITLPMITQPRTQIRFMTNGRTDESEAFFMEKEIKFGADYYGNVGYGFWYKAYRSTAPLTPENLKKAYLAMTAFEANGGRSLGVSPNLLVIPKLLKFKAIDVLKRTIIDGSTNPLYELLEVLESGHLNTVPKTEG